MEPLNETAVSVLARVAAEVLSSRGLRVPEWLANDLQADPDFESPASTRRAIARLWEELNRAVTAEVGSALVRDVDDWTESDWTPRIITAEPDEFGDSPADGPYGWLPLAKEHHREAGWDFPATSELGTWIGCWEPEGACGGSEGHRRTVTGVITSFIIVREGNLEYAHVVTGRRRTGIASKLVEYAKEHHGLVSAHGHRTNDGTALLAALDLDH